MTESTPVQRLGLARRLRAAREEVVARVTAETLRREPQWLARFGESAGAFCREDAGFHVDFLTAAIENNTLPSFENYVGWVADVLSRRGISVAHLARSLTDVGEGLAAGLPDADRSLLKTFLDAGLTRCVATPAPAQTGDAPFSELDLFVEAILAGQRTGAVNIAREALLRGRSILDLYADTIQPALYAVGRRWQENRISVAQEHMATAIAQFVMSTAYAAIAPAKITRGRAVVTGVPGEMHQVGANMIADVLEHDGWAVRFLGTNLPTSGVVAATQEHQATLVGISCTMLFNVPQARRLIAELRSHYAPDRLRILVGGGAFRFAPELWTEVGADATAQDVRGAVTLARTHIPPETPPAAGAETNPG